jgi:hypothetical protein
MGIIAPEGGYFLDGLCTYWDNQELRKFDCSIARSQQHTIDYYNNPKIDNLASNSDYWVVRTGLSWCAG